MPEEEKTNEPDKGKNAEMVPEVAEKTIPEPKDTEEAPTGNSADISSLMTEIATLRGTIDAMSARMSDMDRAFRSGAPAPRPPEPPKMVSIDDLFE